MAVDFDIGAAIRAAASLNLGPAVGRMRQRAVGTLRRRLQAEAVRALTSRFNIAARMVRPRAAVAPEGTAGVKLVGQWQPIEAQHFGGRWGGRRTPGATWQVAKTGTREVLPGTFIRKSDAAGKIMKRVGDTRLPIKRQYGPGVAAMMQSDRVTEQLMEFAGGVLTAEVARLIDVELRALRGQ